MKKKDEETECSENEKPADDVHDEVDQTDLPQIERINDSVMQAGYSILFSTFS